MPRFETLSKRAAVAALLAVTGLQVALHPDVTPGIRAAALVAFAVGWIAARAGAHALWLLLAPLAPALVLLADGRQGPIVDLVWTAGLAGSLLRLTSTARWNLPPLTAVLLGGWALVLSLAWPVMVARELRFELDALRDFTTLNSWAALPAPHVVAWTLYVVQIQLLGLLWFDWATGAIAAAADRLPRAVHALWIGVTAASVVALIQGTVDISFLNVTFWIDEVRATGTMLDANAYGTAAALAAPLAFLAIGWTTPLRIAASVAVLAVNWGGIWMSSSKTAFLLAILGAAGLAVGLARSRTSPLADAGDTPAAASLFTRPMVLTTAATVAALFVLFAGAIGPLQRIAAMSGDPQDVALSLWNREGYGTIADAMVRDYPLTGVGIGAYRYLAPDYWREIYQAQLQLDNAQNWWRHQAAELGILGGAFVVLWSFVVGWHVVAGRARAARVVEAWTVRALLAGIGVISLFGIPTQHPVVLLLFFLLAAWLPSVVTVPATVAAPRPRLLKTLSIAAVICAVSYAAGHLLLAGNSLAVPERATAFKREYVEGAYPPEELPDERVFRWTDDESRFILPARGEAVMFQLRAHHPDIGEHPVTFTMSSPCGPVIQRELSSSMPVAVGVLIPAGLSTVDATITVSRTWSPAELGGTDTRRLGVGVGVDVVSREFATTRDWHVTWPTCEARQ